MYISELDQPGNGRHLDNKKPAHDAGVGPDGGSSARSESVIRSGHAARGGFEPPHTAPKAAVLPLDDRALTGGAARRRVVIDWPSYEIGRYGINAPPPEGSSPPVKKGWNHS